MLPESMIRKVESKSDVKENTTHKRSISFSIPENISPDRISKFDYTAIDNESGSLNIQSSFVPDFESSDVDEKLSKTNRDILHAFLVGGTSTRGPTGRLRHTLNHMKKKHVENNSVSNCYGRECHCSIIVSQSGSNRDSSNDKFGFIFELRLHTTPRTTGRLLMVAKRWSRARTAYYILSMDSSDLHKVRKCRGDGFLGKLRGDESGHSFTLYDHQNAHLRRELAAVVFGAKVTSQECKNKSRKLSSIIYGKKNSNRNLFDVLDRDCIVTTDSATNFSENLQATKLVRNCSKSSIHSLSSGSSYDLDFDCNDTMENKLDASMTASLQRMDVAITLPLYPSNNNIVTEAELNTQQCFMGQISPVVNLAKRLRFIVKKGRENIELSSRIYCLFDPLGRAHVTKMELEKNLVPNRIRRISWPPRKKRELLELTITIPSDEYFRSLLRSVRRKQRNDIEKSSNSKETAKQKNVSPKTTSFPLSTINRKSNTPKESLPLPPMSNRLQTTQIPHPPPIPVPNRSNKFFNEESLLNSVLGRSSSDLELDMLSLAPAGVFDKTHEQDWGKGARSRISGNPAEIFELKFRQPITPLQAFGIAIARLSGGGRF